MLKTITTSRYFLWALLTLPAVPMIAALASGAADDRGRLPWEFLLHPTGEFSARFMIIAMALTPLRMMFPKNRFVHWLFRHRREFGVAAFMYAAFHTIFYVVDMGSLQTMLDEFWAFGIWTGWLAMFIFVPLAVTSNDISVRAVGRRWKTLQRFVYVAAVATLLHWMFVHNEIGGALVHFIPLAALETYRNWRNTARFKGATA